MKRTGRGVLAACLGLVGLLTLSTSPAMAVDPPSFEPASEMAIIEVRLFEVADLVLVEREKFPAPVEDPTVTASAWTGHDAQAPGYSLADSVREDLQTTTALESAVIHPVPYHLMC